MRDKSQAAAGSFNGHSNRCGSWIDIKSFLAGILAMGFFLVLQENARRYNIKLWGAEDHIASVHNNSGRPVSMGRVPESAMIPAMSPCPAASPGQDLSVGSRIHVSNSSAAPAYDVDSSGAKSTARLEKEAAAAGGESSEKLREVRRSFRVYGRAAALFVEMGAYRGGPTSFAVVGLASKPIHVFGEAGFECEWEPARADDVSPVTSVKGVAEKMLPDWNMGRQYTVVVVNCSFGEAVGGDRRGGQLILHASYGHVEGSYSSGAPTERPTERIVALTEAAGEYDPGAYQAPFPYDFVYCGSPLYGDLNPQRIREWIAYHAWRLGPRSHFFIYDAGGVSGGVRRALLPWQRLGYVTVYDVRQQEAYDGYYHNQFLIVNDCFHRARFLSNWTFFFDVDEYLYVPPNETLYSVMDGFSGYTQILFLQKPMSATLCQPKRASTHGTDDTSRDAGESAGEGWGFEKLVYRNIKEGITWDRKYAIQPRNAFATGIHRSDHIVGASLGYELDSIVPKIRYYHYHATINHMGELCREVPYYNATILINATTISSSSSSSPHHLVFYDSNQVPFALDTGLQALAPSVKQFELHHIGPQPTVAT